MMTAQSEWTSTILGAALEVKEVLLRGHQILEPDDYWGVVDSLGVPRQIAKDWVSEAIKDATATAVNAPYFEYLDELLKRLRKLSCEKQSDKHSQEIFKTRGLCNELTASWQ